MMVFRQLSRQPYQTLCFLLTLIYFTGYSLSRFLAAGRDDTLIMLWAGQTLGYASWFVNFNYEPQEIASSILGVFIAALTKGLSISHALLFIKLLGLAAGCATLMLIWSKFEAVFAEFPDKHWLVAGAALATAVSPVFQYWALGGLETPYHALLLLAFCLFFVRSLTRPTAVIVDWWLAGAGCLLILARTESFWPILVAGGLSVVMRRFLPVQAATMRALYLSVMFFFFIMVLRYVFTGALWPNPVYAKVGSFEIAIPRGWKYLLEYYNSSPWGLLQSLAFLYGVAALARLCIYAVRRDKPSVRLMYEAVLGSMVLFHQLFVILSGGNWMEYFRFMAAIVPLLNILALSMIGELTVRVRAVVPNNLLALGLILIAILLSMTQIGRAGDRRAGYLGDVREGSCARAIEKEIFAAGIESLSQSLLINNCNFSRDWRAIKPFLDQRLPELLQKAGGRLTVISYQAGFFPYFIRQKYSPEQVWFIDSAGLTELQIARLPGKKISMGHFDAGRIDLALFGKAGALSEYLQKHPPDMVYQLRADPIFRENLLHLGYKVVWDEEGAVVFFRQPQLAK